MTNMAEVPNEKMMRRRQLWDVYPLRLPGMSADVPTPAIAHITGASRAARNDR